MLNILNCGGLVDLYYVKLSLSLAQVQVQIGLVDFREGAIKMFRGGGALSISHRAIQEAYPL